MIDLSTTNAPLIEAFGEECTMVEKRRVPDGQGGFTNAYTDGEHFMAAISKDTTLQAQIAEKEGVTSVYKVTTAKGVGLEFHELFRRLSDKQVFRVTSDFQDSKPPKVATFSFEQVRAEKWELVE